MDLDVIFALMTPFIVIFIYVAVFSAQKKKYLQTSALDYLEKAMGGVDWFLTYTTGIVKTRRTKMIYQARTDGGIVLDLVQQGLPEHVLEKYKKEMYWFSRGVTIPLGRKSRHLTNAKWHKVTLALGAIVKQGQRAGYEIVAGQDVPQADVPQDILIKKYDELLGFITHIIPKTTGEWRAYLIEFEKILLELDYYYQFRLDAMLVSGQTIFMSEALGSLRRNPVRVKPGLMDKNKLLQIRADLNRLYSKFGGPQ